MADQVHSVGAGPPGIGRSGDRRLGVNPGRVVEPGDRRLGHRQGLRCLHHGFAVLPQRDNRQAPAQVGIGAGRIKPDGLVEVAQGRPRCVGNQIQSAPPRQEARPRRA